MSWSKINPIKDHLLTILSIKSPKTQKEENKIGESVGGENRHGSCGLFARWLVAFEEGDEAGGRDAY
ncbi:hypothetical protein LXL04_020623 [Taraxacum kok-saghyz]